MKLLNFVFKLDTDQLYVDEKVKGKLAFEFEIDEKEIALIEDELIDWSSANLHEISKQFNSYSPKAIYALMGLTDFINLALSHKEEKKHGNSN